MADVKMDNHSKGAVPKTTTKLISLSLLICSKTHPSWTLCGCRCRFMNASPMDGVESSDAAQAADGSGGSVPDFDDMAADGSGGSVPDFDDMAVLSDLAVPFVVQWSADESHRLQLDVAFAGVAAMCFAVSSKMQWGSLAIFRAIASRALIPDEQAQVELSPLHWLVVRPYAPSVVRFVGSLSDKKKCLLTFQLSAALNVLAAWIADPSPAVTNDLRDFFQGLRVMLFDLVTLVTAAAPAAVANVIDSAPATVERVQLSD